MNELPNTPAELAEQGWRHVLDDTPFDGVIVEGLDQYRRPIPENVRRWGSIWLYAYTGGTPRVTYWRPIT